MTSNKGDCEGLNFEKSSSQFIKRVQKALIMIVRAKQGRQSGEVKVDTCRQLGTGFFINPKGTAITNCHVLKLFDEPLTQDEALAAVYFDSVANHYICTALKKEAKTFRHIDIAVMELNCKPASWLPLYEGIVNLGDVICTLGYPVRHTEEGHFSLSDIKSQVKFCCTTISSIRKQDFVCNKGLIELRGKRLLEIDRYMSYGCSGSPVLRSNDGQVTGVVVGTTLHVEDTLYATVYEPNKEKESLKPIPFIVPTSFVISVEEILPVVGQWQSET